MPRPTLPLRLPVRVPTLSGTPHPPAPKMTLAASVDAIVDFLSRGDTLVLTGAGVSVDSGIRVSMHTCVWVNGC